MCNQDNCRVTKKSSICNLPSKPVIFTLINLMHLELYLEFSELGSAWTLFLQPEMFINKRQYPGYTEFFLLQIGNTAAQMHAV